MSGFVELTAADGHRLAAYVAGSPEADRGIVVLQEIFGVNAYIRSVCDDLASRGYRAVAPALFDRQHRDFETGYSSDEARRGLELRRGLDDADALEDIRAAARLLPDTRAVIGFCLGGTLAWQAATRSDLFRAASAWYGSGIAGDSAAPLRCPVQLHFGATDHGIPLADAERLRGDRPDVEVHIYPDAGHGFGCTARASHHAPSAALAWERTHEFLGRHLG